MNKSCCKASTCHKRESCYTTPQLIILQSCQPILHSLDKFSQIRTCKVTFSKSAGIVYLCIYVLTKTIALLKVEMNSSCFSFSENTREARFKVNSVNCDFPSIFSYVLFCYTHYQYFMSNFICSDKLCNVISYMIRRQGEVIVKLQINAPFSNNEKKIFSI